MKIGSTPYDLQVTKGEPSFDVQVRLDGFRPLTKTITTLKNEELDFELVGDGGGDSV